MWNPSSKLTRISRRPCQLWVVAYVNRVDRECIVPEGEPLGKLANHALADVESAFEGGADAVVLINEWASLSDLEGAVRAVRARFPREPLGVNYLGDADEPYGFRQAFRLARDYRLQIAWTDFSGVDLIRERPDLDLHAVERERPAEVFYCSGAQMKYSTLREPEKPIERSVLQAAGWVDGVVITGPRTGVPCDPEWVRRARRALGTYPLGVASGVSAENAASIASEIDFCLVASSLQGEGKRVSREKVQALARSIEDARMPQTSPTAPGTRFRPT